MIKYVYPHLPAIKTTPFIRYAGSGLANSLFVFARAIVFAKEHNLTLINPTWLNFDPVQWKLWAKDKRLYNDTFNTVGITGLKRLKLLLGGKMVKEESYINNEMDADWVQIFYMKGFESLRDKSEMVCEYLENCVKHDILATVKAFNFTNKIAVHIRLGDYSPENRLPLSYYKSLIEQIHKAKPQYEFLVFSDGKDEEMKDVLNLSCTQKAFFGSAMSDIFAISSCMALIGSHSTFTDWGGYLGQLPVLLPKKPHYGSFLKDLNKEFIVDVKEPFIPELFYSLIR